MKKTWLAMLLCLMLLATSALAEGEAAGYEGSVGQLNGTAVAQTQEAPAELTEAMQAVRTEAATAKGTASEEMPKGVQTLLNSGIYITFPDDMYLSSTNSSGMQFWQSSSTGLRMGLSRFDTYGSTAQWGVVLANDGNTVQVGTIHGISVAHGVKYTSSGYEQTFVINHNGVSYCVLSMGMTIRQRDDMYEIVGTISRINPNTASSSYFISYGVLSEYSGTAEEIVLPPYVKKIDREAFAENAYLRKVTLQTGVEEIEYRAFYKCTALEEVVIPATVQTVGTSVFWGCTALKEVNLPQGLTSIPDYTFYQCESLEEVEIPETVTSIGRSAFTYCESLRSITFPEGVTSIGFAAMKYCVLLTEVYIPDGVRTIDGSVFAFCRSLTSVEIPDSVTSIGVQAFISCGALKQLRLPEGLTEVAEGLCNGCESLRMVYIPDSVTVIGKNAFKCRNLPELRIPKGVTALSETIASYVTTVYLPAELTQISGTPFGSNLRTVYCYAGSAGAQWASAAGYNVIYLDPVTLSGPGKLQLIDGTEMNWKQLVEVNGNGTANDLSCVSSNTSVVLVQGDYIYPVSPGMATLRITMTNYAVEPLLIDVKVLDLPGEFMLPDDIRIIGTEAFTNLAARDVFIPAGAERIEARAFANCSELRRIYIPDTVEYISNDAFSGCSAVTVYTEEESTAYAFAQAHGFEIVIVSLIGE